MTWASDDLAHRPLCPSCGHDFTLQDWFYSEGSRCWQCSVCGLIMTSAEMKDNDYSRPDNGLVLGKYPDNRDDN